MKLYHHSKELNLGRAGEHLVMFDLLMQGYQCYMTDQGVSYDVVVDLGYRLLRLQVKTTREASRMSRGYATKTYFFHVRRAGRRGERTYDLHEFDGFACVALDVKQVAYIPFVDKMNKSLNFRDRRMNYGHNSSPYQSPYLDEFPFTKFLEFFDLNYPVTPLNQKPQQDVEISQLTLFE